MKKCPFCAEEIQDDAVKCRYCGEYFVDKEKKPASSQVSRKNSNSLLKIIIALVICYFLVRGCKNFIVSTGKRSDDPEIRAEAQRLEENVKGLGDAFWKGLTGQ